MRELYVALSMCFFAPCVMAQEFTTLKGHGGPVMSIDVHQTTGQVLTGSFDNSVGLWDGRNPVWLEGHDAAVNAVLSVDETLAVSSADDFSVILWNLNENDHTKLNGHKGKVVAVDVSPDKSWLASASWDGSIGLWSLKTGGQKILSGHRAGVNDVAFGEDGKTLFSASADGTIRLWEFTDEEPRSRVLVDQGFGVNRLILGPGDDWLAYGAVDGVTRVVNPEDGATLVDFSLERRPILALAYHVDSGQLAVGDGHGYIMIIDTKDWKIVRDFRAMRRGPVWALAFSSEGNVIYAGGLEDVVYSWPVTLLDKYDPAGTDDLSFLRDPDAMPNGERQFMRKCSICHALTPPPSRKAGPSLHGVFGRRAGTIAGYPYSEILLGSDIVWNEDTINKLFDQGPDHYIPGSKMPMQRIASDADRQDLIAYLRDATSHVAE